MDPDKLLTVDDALAFSKDEMLELNKTYMNKSLFQLMSLAKFTKHIVRAKGTKVYDNEGDEYTDFLGGYGALNIGHNHPEVFRAMDKVKDRPNLLQVCPGTFSAVLARNLSMITPGKLQRTFLCNSGAEAVETAIKLARIATGKTTILSANNSFHGKTFGALTLTGREKYGAPFQPLVPQVFYFPYNDINALRELIRTHDPAALIIEPIQGEGGVIVPSKGYLQEVRKLCDEYGVLFIADEIQTGFGRTGKMFACDHEGIAPDIMCLAKSLSGGYVPVGAMITTDKIWQKGYGTLEKAALHTSTFGGNTLASAAGIAAIEILTREQLSNKTEEKGTYFIEKLKVLEEKYELIKEVRGKGLLIGIEFKEPEGVINKLTGGMLKKIAHEYIGAMVASKLLNDYKLITAYTLNNPNVIRVEPPLTIEYDEIDQFIKALDEIMSNNKGLLSLTIDSGKRFFSS